MKTCFKKLFVSILAYISVVPSINFKVGAKGIFTINSVQDWMNICERIRLDEHYSEGKNFVLNTDLVIDSRDEGWIIFAGNLDGRGHTITLRGGLVAQPTVAIFRIGPGGVVSNVKFDGPYMPIYLNQGQIDNCSSTCPNKFVELNTQDGVIRNCTFSGDSAAVENCGTIENCERTQPAPAQHN